MSIFTIFLFCVQAFLVQNAYSQFIGTGLNPAYAPRCSPRFAPAMIPALNPPEPFSPARCGQAYGGEGIGDIAIAGRMPVAGTTAVKGQVPILGSVRFGGDVPAAGTVTITGSCGCRGRYF